MELLDVLDAQGNKTGQVKDKDQVHKDGDWHAVASLWISNNNKEILLQKRSFTKVKYPSCWSESAAGHVDAGETPEESIIRETKEEIGLVIPKEDLVKLTQVSKKSELPAFDYYDAEHKIIYLYFWNGDISQLTLDEREVEEVKWITPQQLKEEIHKQKSNKEGPKRYIPYEDEFLDLIAKHI